MNGFEQLSSLLHVSEQDQEGERQMTGLVPLPTFLMEGDHPSSSPEEEEEKEEEKESGLDAFRDAREIIRQIQCSVCSCPLRQPVALPCGNSICRRCLPERYVRQGISYPDMPGRQEGFECPFADCGREHSIADCALDVTLTKVMEIIEAEFGKAQLELNEETALELMEVLDYDMGMENCNPHARTLHGGRLAATYALAQMGELPYDVDVTYKPLHGESSDFSHLDFNLLKSLKDKTRSELECQVCYALYLDPITTYCGHTYCRKCLERVLDHSQRCPSCRRCLNLPSVLPAQSSNKKLTEFLVGLCPNALAERAAMAAQEETAGVSDSQLSTPIFVCTTAYPGMPTPLHIFEPRYRLMMRRAWEDGTRRFGMVLPNRTGEPQGELGDCPFLQYGTMLRIEGVNIYPDGRSDVWTVGISRFKVKRWGLRDEYIVGEIERMDDIPILQEEALEALDTCMQLSPPSGLQPPWTRLSTRALLQIGHQFVDQMQAMSVPWLHENNILAFGQRPDDPAMFPYWLASVLPVAESEKYRLLCCTSVRERLKIIVGWIKRIETHRWFQPNNCVII